MEYYKISEVKSDGNSKDVWIELEDQDGKKFESIIEEDDLLSIAIKYIVED